MKLVTDVGNCIVIVLIALWLIAVSFLVVRALISDWIDIIREKKNK